MFVINKWQHNVVPVFPPAEEKVYQIIFLWLFIKSNMMEMERGGKAYLPTLIFFSLKAETYFFVEPNR